MFTFFYIMPQYNLFKFVASFIRSAVMWKGLQAGLLMVEIPLKHCLICTYETRRRHFPDHGTVDVKYR